MLWKLIMNPTKEGKDNEEQLLNLIKTILTNSNVLEEAIAEKRVNEQPPVTNTKPPLPRLDHIGQFSEEILDNMAKKIQNIILKSEEFNKQVENLVMKKMKTRIKPNKKFVI